MTGVPANIAQRTPVLPALNDKAHHPAPQYIYTSVILEAGVISRVDSPAQSVQIPNRRGAGQQPEKHAWPQNRAAAAVNNSNDMRTRNPFLQNGVDSKCQPDHESRRHDEVSDRYSCEPGRGCVPPRPCKQQRRWNSCVVTRLIQTTKPRSHTLGFLDIPALGDEYLKRCKAVRTQILSGCQ